MYALCPPPLLAPPPFCAAAYAAACDAACRTLSAPLFVDAADGDDDAFAVDASSACVGVYTPVRFVRDADANTDAAAAEADADVAPANVADRCATKDVDLERRRPERLDSAKSCADGENEYEAEGE